MNTDEPSFHACVFIVIKMQSHSHVPIYQKVSGKIYDHWWEMHNHRIVPDIPGLFNKPNNAYIYRYKQFKIRQNSGLQMMIFLILRRKHIIISSANTVIFLIKHNSFYWVNIWQPIK